MNGGDDECSFDDHVEVATTLELEQELELKH